MNEVLPLINGERAFLLFFDSPSLNKFLTEFAPSCIDKHYDERCACGVCFQVYEQRQPNGRFESSGKLTIAEGTGWLNFDDDGRAYNIYNLKIYLTTSGADVELWEKFSREISAVLGQKDKAWENFKEKIAGIKKSHGLNAKIILTELNKTNEMSQELKKMIADKLNSWEKFLEEIRNPGEEELQKNCVCLDLKKDNNGEMYFDYQKYEHYQPRENGDDKRWKIYLKEEYRYQARMHVIYFEKSDKVEEKNENSATLISNNKNKIENSIRSKNKDSDVANENQNDTQESKSDTSSNRNSLNKIKYEQQNMKKDKNKNRNVEKDNSIDNKDKNGDINNQQSESNKGSELEIKYKNKSEIDYENPNNKQVTKPQRKPTVRYIILAVTVIFLIIFSYLAFKSYQFNCELEKNALQTLKNNRQKNPEVNQNKNREQQIPAIDVDYEPDKQNNLEQEEN